jgi:hypothetical protein
MPIRKSWVMKYVANASYLVALACTGSVAITLGLTPLVTFLPEAVVALGWVREPDVAKLVLYAVIDVSWLALLIWAWIHYGTLVPRATRSGFEKSATLGQSLIGVGHLTVLSIFVVEEVQWMMILPVLVVIVCYGVGVVLVERSRLRSGPTDRRDTSG